MSEVKYVVEVRKIDKAQRIPREILDEVKGVISSKMVSSMRKEVVSCPVQSVDIPFLICFTCSNFIRRVSGKIHCRGLPLN